MKKILLIGALCSLLFAPCVFAAGTVTQTIAETGRDVRIITLSWTGDASDGSVPSTAISWALADFVFLVVTNPGSTAPTDNYDITLTDSDGVDIMGGEITNRDTSNTEQAVPKIGSVYGTRFVSGTLTFNLTGNIVAGATGTVKIYVWGGR
jgi:hypothetical protein